MFKVNNKDTRLQNMSKKIPFLVIYHLHKFDDFIENGFWIIPNITITNLCKPIHDVIIIVVSSDALNVETLKG